MLDLVVRTEANYITGSQASCGHNCFSNVVNNW